MAELKKKRKTIEQIKRELGLYKDVKKLTVDDVKAVIQVGDELKYQDLCSKLSIEPKAGKSKQLQIEKLERLMSMEKAGLKFIIKDIYDKPIEVPKALRKDAIYTKYIEFILLSYLDQQKDHTSYHSYKEWWLILGMVNNKYQHCCNTEAGKLQLLSLDDKMDDEQIDYFYWRTDNKFRKVFDNAIKSLKKRLLIVAQDEFIIYPLKGKYTDEHWAATDGEIKAILGMRRQVLEEMGYDNEGQIFLNKKLREKYNNRLSELEAEFGWRFVKPVIKIISNKKYLKTALAKDEADLKKMLVEFNEVIITAIDKQAATKIDKYRDDYNTIKELIDMELAFEDDLSSLSPDEQFELQKLLSHYLLKVE